MSRKVRESAPTGAKANGQLTAKAPSKRVSLEVMNPRASVARRPVVAPAPRARDLAGKRVGIYWNGKAGANNFFDVIEELLTERFPAATIVRFEGPLDAGDAAAAAMAKDADTVIYGIGD